MRITKKLKYLFALYINMIKPKMDYLAKVTTGGRVTIPVQTRKKEGIEKGDYVWIIVEKPSFEGPKEKTDEEAEKRK